MPAPRKPSRVKLRKRPRQARAQETVDAILEGAARILETHGFPGYTTNAIARAAGVSIGSLYQYFPGKDAITAALLARETSLLLAQIRDTKHAASFDAALREIVYACVIHQIRRPVLARLLDIEEARLPLARQNAEVLHTAHQTFRDLLERPDAPRSLEGPAEADMLAIIKGMVDAAGERGERHIAPLVRRVLRALNGYLGIAAD